MLSSSEVEDFDRRIPLRGLCVKERYTKWLEIAGRGRNVSFVAISTLTGEGGMAEGGLRDNAREGKHGKAAVLQLVHFQFISTFLGQTKGVKGVVALQVDKR